MTRRPQAAMASRRLLPSSHGSSGDATSSGQARTLANSGRDANSGREAKRTVSGTLPKLTADAGESASAAEPGALESGVLPVVRLDESSEPAPHAPRPAVAVPRGRGQAAHESPREKRVMRAPARHDLAPPRTIQRAQPVVRAKVELAPATRERPRALAIAGIALVALFWV